MTKCMKMWCWTKILRLHNYVNVGRFQRTLYTHGKNVVSFHPFLRVERKNFILSKMYVIVR